MDNRIINELKNGETCLGIEFGSTRIKAILIDSTNIPIASGGFNWSNSLIDGIWTYSENEIKTGLQECYLALKKDVIQKYEVKLTNFKAIGISGMMHGIIAVNKNNKILTPFRTWRNNITKDESEFLSEKFSFPVAQRWTITHLYKFVLENETFLPELDYISTLSGYVHRLLTGEKVLGIDDASGMFPIDVKNGNYYCDKIQIFNSLINDKNYKWQLEDILPKVLKCGEPAGKLTKKGSLLLDPSGDLTPGIMLCPPEGDAGTGMVSTNSVKPRTGNVSAGTSVFAMIVLEKELKENSTKLDLVTTPDGNLVAMAHSNNCTGEYDQWISLFNEVIESTGNKINKEDLYDCLLSQTLKADPDCGGLLAFGYISGEHQTGFSEGRPLFTRKPDSLFNLPNFMRTQMYTSLCAMRIGLDYLFEDEKVTLDCLTGQGGFFKTEKVGQTIMAIATHTPVKILQSAGEGGAWGIALLASFMVNSKDKNLPTFLDTKVFNQTSESIITPKQEDIEGFNKFLERYKKGLKIEREAIKSLL